VQLCPARNPRHGVSRNPDGQPGGNPPGCLGAENIFPQRLWHFGLRRLFDGLRSIDTLIWALMFVNAGGLRFR
jgi:hypothetical protein